MEGKDKLFDEFGNYYGEVDDSEDSDDSFDMKDSKEDDFLAEKSDTEEQGDSELGKDNEEDNSEDDGAEDRVVLFEDKKYYPELEEAYPEAEVMIEEEDAMDIEQPILPPPKKQDFNFTTKTHLERKYFFNISKSLYYNNYYRVIII